MAKIRFTKSSTPATPPTGKSWLYIDKSDNHIKIMDDLGNIIDLTTSATAPDHNDLTGIQGGDIDDYQHITTSQAAQLSAIMKTNISIFLDLTQGTVLCNTETADITTTLPAADMCVGKIYSIKKIAAGNQLTIIGSNNETIDNEEAVLITANNTNVRIQSDGSNWFII